MTCTRYRFLFKKKKEKGKKEIPNNYNFTMDPIIFSQTRMPFVVKITNTILLSCKRDI